MDTALRAWLALNRTPGLSSASVHALLDHFGHPEAIFATNPSGLQQVTHLRPTAAAALRNPDWTGADRDLRWSTLPGHHIITLADPRYPPLLRHIPQSAPPVLFVAGNPQALLAPQVAFVGSRSPTPAGCEIATELATALCHQGFAITSGLAVGIDGAGHSAALAADGTTIAVTATGLDRTYPARHQRLAEEIVATGKGALVSEFPVGTPPLKEHFPRRNRIISGLSLGTLVVEAALRSGSLITARFALEQGREVFAVPGSIRNPLARGCHALIRDGAKLVETADDIIVELGISPLPQLDDAVSNEGNKVRDPELKAAEDVVLHALGYEPATVDVLVERTGLTAEELSSILMELELEGCIASMSGGFYFRQARRGRK